MRTTVLVPLHASARWLPVLTGTIERLAPHARFLVSDATGADDTLDRLRARFGELENVAWLGPRPLRAGWVAHCNDLLDRAATELVMWMPHDDETDAAWVTLGEQALRDNPDAVLALGRLQSLERDELGRYDRELPSQIVHDPHPPFLRSDPCERVREALNVCLHGDGSLLGIAFRGVFRRESAVPLPETGPGGRWADQLWATSMLGVGSFAATEAVYWKRWYDGSAHSRWEDLRAHPTLRTELLPAAVAPLSPQHRVRVLREAWADDAAELESRIADLEEQRDTTARAVEELGEQVLGLEQARGELQAELAVARARVRVLRRRLRKARASRAAQRRRFEESASWRLTAPLRRAAAVLRRIRRGPHPG